jgi:hypothetical protein
VWRNFSICHSRLMQWPVPSIHVYTGSASKQGKSMVTACGQPVTAL